MSYRDTREPSKVVIRGGVIVEGVVGGYGPWKITPPLRFRPFDPEDIIDGEYLSEPLPMSQDELHEQHVWASARSDRKQWRPEKVAA